MASSPQTEHLAQVLAMASAPRPLRSCALAALGQLEDPASSEELQCLREPLEALGDDWLAAARAAEISPATEDVGLVQLGRQLGLSLLELLTVSLSVAVEEDARAGCAVAFLQAPIGSSRPTLGLLARAFAGAAQEGADPLRELAGGAALASGLLARVREDAPLTEQAVSVPLSHYLALCGRDADWPGATIGLGSLAPVPLPDSTLEAVRRHAGALAEAGRGALVLRCASPVEGRSVAAAICRELGRRPLFLEGDRLAGLGPFLLQRGLVPVHVHELGPGDRKALPSIPFYRGPVLALIGREGTLDAEGQGALRWTISVPAREERRALWEDALGEGPLSAELARQHRQGAGRIAQLGTLARRSARLAGRERPLREDILAAAWSAEGGGLGTLAEPLPDPVNDDALVLPSELSQQLDLLLARCRARDGLPEGLGPSAKTRYRAGVRALFVGASGTGKTLAAGWLATRLSLPLYRVDLASVTSKYIGETEKNLAQLFALAEHGDLILLFDEADSLFGKRTDVRDSNDRFANAQTNYLLQRIESFEGIAVLTSNSKSRFDTAFMRRLDAIVDFPMPGASERRALWESHLGGGHALQPRDLGRLVAVADLTGGQIRNVVLTAAVLARDAGRPIQLSDVVRALQDEYRKVGRDLPSELRAPK
ncbi:MAG TPA: ATP-binding protein [Myxococcales bacterium]|nr:ATP-binding protein [Myxococcales bacterium]